MRIQNVLSRCRDGRGAVGTTVTATTVWASSFLKAPSISSPAALDLFTSEANSVEDVTGRRGKTHHSVAGGADDRGHC